VSALLALLALQAAAPAQPAETVITVFVLARGAPAAERRVSRRQPFYQQDLLTESGIRLDLPPAALDAFRNRHDLDDHAPFLLVEWIARTEGSEAPSRHLGWLHCSSRLVTFVGQVNACFRDGDGDGRLDAATTFASNRFPAEGLRFTPLETPIPYRFVPVVRTPHPWSMYTQNNLALTYDLDRATARLNFSVEQNIGLFAEFKPAAVEVDPARLPVTIELAGAQVAVLAWDGRRATVRVDRPMTDQPLRLIGDRQGGRRGWRLEIVDAPLPGAAAPR
jgi:hypothetical protein